MRVSDVDLPQKQIPSFNKNMVCSGKANERTGVAGNLFELRIEFVNAEVVRE